MISTSFLEKESFIKELQVINASLKEDLQKINIPLNSQGFAIRKDTYHFLANMLKPKNRIERTYYSILLESCYKTETLSSSSAWFAIQFGISFLEELLKYPDLNKLNEVELFAFLAIELQDYQESILKFHEVIAEDQLYEYIQSTSQIHDKLLNTAIQECINIAGLEGKIHIEDGSTNNYVIDQKMGHFFHAISPFKFMLPPDGIWEDKNVKVLLIDGILERVSELDKIFTKAMDTKIPLLLISHGFSEEVISTIKVNNDYKKFNVLPLKLTSDLESINVLNDIAVVCGSDIVSTLKGEMLIFVDFDQLPLVNQIRLTMKELMIENPKTRASVSNHLRSLLEKRQENHQISDLSDLIDKRIQSLLTASVTLRLPTMSPSQKEHSKVQIDIALRNAKTLLNYGFSNIRNAILDFSYKESKTILHSIIIKSLKKMPFNDDLMPCLSAFMGVYFVSKTIINIVVSGGLIQIDT